MALKKSLIKEDIRKEVLLLRLSNEGRSLLFFYDEDPREDLKDVRYETVDAKRHIIHPPYSYKRLWKWFGSGNWQAVSPPSPAASPINTFKSADEAVFAHMTACEVTLLIDSFYDDIEWSVFEVSR